MYYFIDLIDSNGKTQRHILRKLFGDAIMSFPLTDDNPHAIEYREWIAQGNTPQEWTGE